MQAIVTLQRCVRMIQVGMVLFLKVRWYDYQRFWLFVIGYYLLTLGLEMVLVVRGAPAEQAGDSGKSGVG